MSNTTPGLPPYAVPFGPHANCTLDICPAQYSVYGYQASLPANVAFLSVYIIVAMLHAQLGIMTKHWWFRLFMIAGAINAMLGYTARLFMYDNPFDYTAFQMQIVCITSGSVYFSAALYFVFAETITYLSTDISPFKPQLIYLIYLPCELISLCLQAVGAGLATTTSGDTQKSINIALAGMILQVSILVTFCFLGGDYLVRYYWSNLWKRRFT